jgi:hypothetical protein
LSPSCADYLKNLGASTSWNPQGLARPVMGLFCLYLYHSSILDFVTVILLLLPKKFEYGWSNFTKTNNVLFETRKKLRVKSLEWDAVSCREEQVSWLDPQLLFSQR